MDGKMTLVRSVEDTPSWDPAIAALVEPVAAYICAADDPGQAIAAIVVHLSFETQAIFGEARRSLEAFQLDERRRGG